MLFSIPSSIHVLLYKNDERAAIGWIGLIFLSPFLGSSIYWMFGVNRINALTKLTKAKKKKTNLFPRKRFESETSFQRKWRTLMQAGYAIHDSVYLTYNQIVPLVNGDEAYPRMLIAITNAKRDIVLSSYIFDYDQTGRKFVDALGEARKRNVSVYVLIDGDFLDYRWRMTEKELRKRNVKTARFLPFSPSFMNLRNHRKILCLDGQIAFVGGMNIRQDNMVSENPCKPVQDIHFEVKGPVINQISKTFTDDWCFATAKPINVSSWSGTCDGQVTCRVLPDGPDENYQKLVWTLLAAINSAEYSIRIISPYFIPDHTVICALQSATLRGVDVQLIVPKKNNIPFFNWAMQANFNNLLKFGLKIYLSAPPFEHSKFFLVDDCWSFIGSSNWDTRSFALNFEINIECYDYVLNQALGLIFNEKKLKSELVSKVTCAHYSLYIQLRNNFFRLLSPYL